MGFCFESHTFDWRPDFPLLVTAKRYWDDAAPEQGEDGDRDGDGYTCVCAHGNGFLSELWEPTLQRLFAQARTSRGLRIREAWAVDAPNQGAAGVLNEHVLLRGGYDTVFSWTNYAHALYLFLTENRSVRFGGRKIIAIGHSMGAASLCLTQTYPRPPRFEQLVLCEPVITPTLIPVPVNDHQSSLAVTTMRRRDTWPSLDDAFAALKQRKAFAEWDDEALRLYFKYGFRPLPSPTYPDQEGVTLKCTKVQEAACFRDGVSPRRVYDFLPALCTRVPIHVIWGAIHDTIPRYVKEKVTDAESGREMASVCYMEGVGHLLPQAAPEKLAAAIVTAVTPRNGVAMIPRGKL